MIKSFTNTILTRATISPSGTRRAQVKVNQIVVRKELGKKGERGSGLALLPKISEDESVKFKSPARRRLGKLKRPPI